MIDEEKNIAQTIANLARLSGDAQAISPDDSLIVVPDGCTIHDVESYLVQPRRIKKDTVFISLESFIRYVNTFKTPGSYIHVDRNGNAKCVLDGAHRLATGLVPAWEDHKARYSMKYSVQWNVWYQSNRRNMSQREFASFIENNQPDFLSPAGAHMLDIARTLDAEQNANFKSAIRMENNDVNLSFERTTTVKAGQSGDLPIPVLFTIQVPILEGEEPRQIEIRLRIDLDDGKLKFSYEIMRLQQMLDGVVRSIYATIANATQITPFLVAGTVAQ